MPSQSIIEKLCIKHNIRLVDIRKDPDYIERVGMKGCESMFVNQSSCADGEIVLGIYEDAEKRTASFFHELAHIRSRKYSSRYIPVEEIPNMHSIEKYLWEYGFRFAKKLGIEFSDETLEYCDNQLSTYEWHKMTVKRIKAVVDSLRELGYGKEADNITLCKCHDGCETCRRLADKYEKEIKKVFTKDSQIRSN